MYRMLIVDDEDMIVDGLYELFKGIGHLDLDIYKAYSSDEALELLDKAKMDIVLSDIRMPGINGLQLLDRIHANWPQCKVIFLTGYSEFDYIYTAVKNKGAGYILKTEDDEVIVKTVEDAISEIETKTRDEELLKNVTRRMTAALPLLQKEFFDGVLEGRENVKILKKSHLEELEIPLNPDMPVLLVLCKVDEMQRHETSSCRARKLYSITSLMEKYLNPAIIGFHVVHDHTYVLWLLQPEAFSSEAGGMTNPASIDDKNRVLVEGMLENVQNACRDYFKIHVSFVLSSRPVEWKYLAERADSLKTLLNYRASGQHDLIFIDKAPVGESMRQEANKKSSIRNADIRFGKRHMLEIYLESGQRNEFAGLLKELTEGIGFETSMHSNPALEVYYSIALVFLSHINKFDLTEVLAFRIGLGKLMRVNEHVSWDEAIRYLHHLAETIFDLRDEEQESKSAGSIEQVKKYILEHLDSELSLIKLAEHVYHNPSYLSRLFKQATGSNLIDYISEVKINKAKRLLEDKSIKIHEVASAVGYDSSTYFATFFKRMTGNSPQEYREDFMNRR